MPKTAEEKRAYMQAWRAAHQEQVRASYAAWAAQNREHRLTYLKTYKKTHLERHRMLQAKYRAADPSQSRAINRRSYAAKPESHHVGARRYRARKAQAAINDLTQAQWLEIQEAFHHCCAYCGKCAKGYLTQDHITPLSRGGNHTASNIVPACRPCNSSKKDRDVPRPIQPLLLTTC